MRVLEAAHLLDFPGEKPAPGVFLNAFFLRPQGLRANHLALHTQVPHSRINEILRAAHPRRVTADTALRLESYLGIPARFWLLLQLEHDLEAARRVAFSPGMTQIDAEES